MIEKLLAAKSIQPPPLAKINEATAPDVHVLDEMMVQLFDLLYHDQPDAEKLAATIRIELLDQIRRARAVANVAGKLDAENTLTDDEIIRQLFNRLPELYEVLLTDIDAAYIGDPACHSNTEVVLCYPGLWAITMHRLAHELYRLHVPLIPRMISESSHRRTGIDIHPGASIGSHFFIDHGTGVVIGETCEIGNHVRIYQGVTLGAATFPVDEQGNMIRGTKRHPTIQDNVVVYAGATVLGGKTVIGHDSVIGSNVWLIESVEPCTTVVMEKPRLKIRKQYTEEFSGSFDFQI